MQADYRAILSEMLLAQAAAVGALADVADLYTSLMGEGCRAAFTTIGYGRQRRGASAGPSQPGSGSGIAGELLPWSSNVCRAMAGLPRVSMMSFLSRYDDLRGRRRDAGSS